MDSSAVCMYKHGFSLMAFRRGMSPNLSVGVTSAHSQGGSACVSASFTPTYRSCCLRQCVCVFISIFFLKCLREWKWLLEVRERRQTNTLLDLSVSALEC